MAGIKKHLWKSESSLEFFIGENRTTRWSYSKSVEQSIKSSLNPFLCPSYKDYGGSKIAPQELTTWQE